MQPCVDIDLLLADSHLWYRPCGFSSGFPPVRKSSQDEALLDIKVISELKSCVLKRSRRQFRTNLPEVNVLAQRQRSNVNSLIKTCVSEGVRNSATTDETYPPRLYFRHYNNFLNLIPLFSHTPPAHPLLLIKPCSPLMENCWFTSHSRGSDNQSSEKQHRVNLLWEWTLGMVPHLCLTCRDTVHLWEPAAQQSYYQPPVYCYNHHLSSQTCMVKIASWFSLSCVIDFLVFEQYFFPPPIFLLHPNCVCWAVVILPLGVIASSG